MCTCGSPFPRGWDEARPGQERSSPNTQGSRPWPWTRIVDRIVARSWHSPSPDPLRCECCVNPEGFCYASWREGPIALRRSRRVCAGRSTEVCIRLTTPKGHDGQVRPAAGPRVARQSSRHDRALTTRIEPAGNQHGRRRKSVKTAHLLMCGSSCKTTFSNELWISRWPL
jgi:hypothetical protein